MIRINLLPVEKRVVKKTPIGIFVIFVFGVCVFIGSIFFSIIMYLNKDKESQKQDDLQKKIAAYAENLRLYDATMQDITQIETATSGAASLIKKELYLSDILKSVSEAVSGSAGIRIEKMRFLDKDKLVQKNQSLAAYNFGVEVKGECSSCFRTGVVDTLPLRLFKRNVIGNPRSASYEVTVVAAEPYKISQKGDEKAMVVEYTYLLAGKFRK